MIKKALLSAGLCLSALSATAASVDGQIHAVYDNTGSQIGSTVEDGPPGIGPPVLDAANSFTGPGARSPAADEFTGSGLVVGDGDGHIDSLGLGHGAANGHGRAL